MIAAGEYWQYVAGSYAVALVLMAVLLAQAILSYRAISKRVRNQAGKHASKAL